MGSYGDQKVLFATKLGLESALVEDLVTDLTYKLSTMVPEPLNVNWVAISELKLP